jgi:hypothetical protein
MIQSSSAQSADLRCGALNLAEMPRGKCNRLPRSKDGMTQECDKCSNSDIRSGSIWTEGDKKYYFCKFCTLVLDQQEQTGCLVRDFLSPNASEDPRFVLDKVQKGILQGKERRKAGIPWESYK